MKYTFLLLFFLVNYLASGQSGIPLRLFIYPNISQPVYRSDGEVSKRHINNVKIFENIKFSYSFGIHTHLTFNEKWSIAMGVNYFQSGYRSKKIIIEDLLIDPIFIVEPNSIFIHSYIEIPVLLERRIFQNEKIKFYMTFGPSQLFGISHKSFKVFSLEGNKIKKEKINNTFTDFKTVNLAASIGVGIELLTKRKYSFYVQPMTQMGLLGMALDAPLNRDIFNFGIATGIILK